MQNSEGLKQQDTPVGRLNSISAVRKEMVRVYRGTVSGKIEAERATKLIWILCQVRDSIELEAVEPAIERLEKLLTEGRSR
ncbi:MAG: hypothetical protein C4527_15140 [Candidatus Omnitrophota bacterium]|jgi:hypothetical protein|nr:MAG: hypothetical protein C4527_15140 [Candidatus Omnitrophota bacterium]